MTEYSEAQKVFVFSMVSGAANRPGTVPELEAMVVKRFDQVTRGYPQYLGSPWTLTWGPVVYQDQGSNVSDNTVFVTRGMQDGRPLHIVAIAGTNPNSMFDRGVDFDIFVQVPFGKDPNVLLSRGTSRDVTVLQSLKSNGRTLQEHLAGIADPNAGLVFTGHSLGGALAPALALDYVLNKNFNLFDAFRVVYVFPTAGPTPGNAAFSRLFDSIFRHIGGVDVNVNLVNSFDIVPKAWANLDRITLTYLKKINSFCIDALVHELIKKVKAAKVSYGNLETTSFDGSFNENAKPVAFPRSEAVRFAVQALYQHINGYVQELIPELNDVFDLPPLTKEQEKQLHDACNPYGGGS